MDLYKKKDEIRSFIKRVKWVKQEKDQETTNLTKENGWIKQENDQAMTRHAKNEGTKQEKTINNEIYKGKRADRTRRNQEITRYIKESEWIKQDKII